MEGSAVSGMMIGAVRHAPTPATSPLDLDGCKGGHARRGRHGTTCSEPS